MTWFKRRSSTFTQSGSLSLWLTINSTWSELTMGENNDFILAINGARLVARGLISMALASILEKSKISFKIFSKFCALFCCVFNSSRCSSVNELSRNKTSPMPKIPFIGVRSSWLILAKNCDFATLAKLALFTAFLSSVVCSATLPSSCWLNSLSWVFNPWFLILEACRFSIERCSALASNSNCCCSCNTSCQLESVLNLCVLVLPKLCINVVKLVIGCTNKLASWCIKITTISINSALNKIVGSQAFATAILKCLRL